MKLSIVVAMDRNGVIGKGDELPWPKIPADMTLFRKLTMGKPIIMGRKTFVSLPMILRGRWPIVLSRNPEHRTSGFLTVVRSPDEVSQMMGDPFTPFDEAFVIGGAQTYSTLADLCDEAHVTRIDREYDGDIMFPFEFRESEWLSVLSERLADGVVYNHLVRKHGVNCDS